MFCHGTSWSAAPCPPFPLARGAGGELLFQPGKASPSRAAAGPSPDLSPQAGIPGGRPACPPLPRGEPGLRLHPACRSPIAFRCVRAAAGLPAARPNRRIPRRAHRSYTTPRDTISAEVLTPEGILGRPLRTDSCCAVIPVPFRHLLDPRSAPSRSPTPPARPPHSTAADASTLGLDPHASSHSSLRSGMQFPLPYSVPLRFQMTR